jgi:hypothetical protein
MPTELDRILIKSRHQRIALAQFTPQPRVVINEAKIKKGRREAGLFPVSFRSGVDQYFATTGLPQLKR